MSAIPLAGGYETFGRSIRWMLDGSATAYARGFRTLLTRNETTRIRGRKARRIERRQIDRPRRAVDDQLGNRLRRRGRVQNAPDAVTRRDIGPSRTGHGANQWQSVLRQWAKAGPAREHGRCRQNGRYTITKRFQAGHRALI